MSDRVAVIKAKWLACVICWVALMFVFAVARWVYGTRGANLVEGLAPYRPLHHPNLRGRILFEGALGVPATPLASAHFPSSAQFP